MTTGTGTPLRERGGCLTVYLVATIFFAIVGLILLITAGALVGVATATGAATGTNVSGVPIVPVIASIIAVIVSIAGVIGAWSWKKWGIYAIVASFVISAAGSTIGGNVGSAVIGLVVEIGLLWYLVRDKWTQFEG